MSGNGSVTVPPDSTGKIIDCTSLSVGGVVAMRQRVIIADPTSSAGFASVTSGRLNVNVSGLVSITGSVVISTLPLVQLNTGTAFIGSINKISATTIVAGVVSLADGSITNISTMPAVVLAAGAAKIGKIAAISATVNVAGTFTISTIDKISATTIVAGVVTLGAAANNIGTINNISATVIVAGSLSIGGFTGGTSVTAASSFTLIGGTDGSLGRVALMDAAGHQIISGTVALTTLNGLGKIDGISAAVVLATGAAHIGEVNISTMPAVVLATGTNNIGTIQAISAAVTIANGATVNISTMPSVVIAAGANNIGTIQAISANVNVLAYKVKLSASAAIADNTLTTGWADTFGRQVTILNHPSLIASATQGPLNKDITATTMAALVVSAGANCIYVTGLLVTNGSATLTRCEICSSDQSAAPQIVAYLAASGGGFSRDFHPPWKLSAGTALHGRLGSGVSGLSVTAVIHFYVGAS